MLLLVLAGLQQYVLFRLGQRLQLTASGRFFWHVLHLPVSFFDMRYAADVASRAQLNDRLAQLLSARLAANLVNLTMIAFYAVVMVQYDVVLTVIGVCVALLNLVAIRFSARRRTAASRRFEQEQGKVLSTSFTGLQMIETLKAGGTESDFFARWAGFQAKSIGAEQDLAVSTSYLSVVPTLLSGITTAAILIVGGERVISGTLSIGVLIAFQYLLAAFSAPVNDLVALGGELQEIDAGIVRLDDVLDYPTDPVIAAHPPAAADGDRGARLAGAFELRNITFGYSRLEPPLLDGFDLAVKPGARVALIGGSGSGKSTVARILCGLYQPWSGEVLFDGLPRTSYPRDVMVNSLALVDQEIVLFDGTVTENITLWDATRARAAGRAGRPGRGDPRRRRGARRRLRQPRRRGRPQLERRAAPAAGDRQGARHRAVDPRARRGHQRPRSDDRAVHRRPAAPARLHLPDRRPPAEHDPRLRRDPGARARPHRAARHPRRR